MAVYTEISLDQAQKLFDDLSIGKLTALKGCSGGIENTNYFATTTQGEYVLTIFERLTFTQLPYYLQLMRHLANKGIAVPKPEANSQNAILFTLANKPAAVVNKLVGQSQLSPTAVHCAAAGHALAAMHLAGQDYELEQANLRGLAWWNETVPVVMPHLGQAEQDLLQSELAFQNHISQTALYQALPRGPVHADLFRDNAMFDGDELSGFFDFYFAGNDAWIFDLAVTINDWCIDLKTGALDLPKTKAMLEAYQAVRPLTTAERQLLPAMLRAGALRFWISRLWDFYLPREASVLQPHDPTHFERVLLQRRENEFPLPL